MIIKVGAPWEYQNDSTNIAPPESGPYPFPQVGWGQGIAPFGGALAPVPEYPPATNWNSGEALWIRRAVMLEGGPVTIKGESSSSLWVYWDGVHIASVNRDLISRGMAEWHVVIPPALCNKGPHTIYIYSVSSPPEIPYLNVSCYYTEPMIPAQPQSPATELLAWKTDIVQAFDSTEDRLQVRKNPRQEFHYSYPVGANHDRLVFNTVTGERVKKWLIPLWTQATPLGTVVDNSDVLLLTTAFHEYRQGSFALIWENADRWQVVAVDDVSSTTLTLSGRTEGFLNAVIMPVRVGRMAGDPNRRTSGYSALYDIKFAVEDNLQFDPPAPLQFKGHDVSTSELLIAETMLSESVKQRVIMLDEELGAVSYRSPWSNARVTRPYMQMTETAEEAWKVKQWLHRCAGKYRQFWQPSFEANLLILNNGGITTKLSARNEGYLKHALSYNHLAFETMQGDWLFREVTSTTDTGNNSMELTLNSSLNMPASNIKRVCYLSMRRLDSDSISFNWIGGGVMQVHVSMAEIEA